MQNTGEQAPAGAQQGILRPISFCAVAAQPGPFGGLVVQAVDETSAPGKAGVAVGDELLSFNGERLVSAEQALAALRRFGIGATVAVDVVRDRGRATLQMQVEARKLTLDLGDLDEVIERKIAPAA